MSARAVGILADLGCRIDVVRPSGKLDFHSLFTTVKWDLIG